ncbi:LysM peptidoglycan-binding domain-containing protein [Lactobacillus delbrueckii subsp. lactis]|uniref:LysM peptidoglycan-binding domain-containing protein n=2 Tax=Lactobacillus TaxID=1578 RepID=A0ABT1XYS7_LACLE|nr:MULTISPECIES: C40 family peptidase [Lactobacillus]APG67686.1 hydrolase [Lactobacillus delbrueckii subsp. lactis]MCD5490175.1 LysM peptidoglycan-binding domain-containing protein [Lactobacillus delbrueckii subsp. lactis]MCD5495686.1 LysM peptidoglycan-binding domain-containing protein [Lactobacillus delbrueckii subsp. lactis]MCD5497409.1 LysM peptidoglycan-binding domain-containing protein [Lactobacillus delbrueckii subsp. lactis]MCD5499146.1 LysM peptidoglycan-binding domain-containing prot
MKKKNLLMTALATLSASGALLTTGASALADSYTVVKNDTLWGLSKKYGVSVSDLKKANGVSGHLIYVGQKLQIPTKSNKATKTAKTSTSTSTVDTTSTTHTVVKGDTLWSLAKKYGVSVSTLMKANNLSSSTILIGQSLNLRAGMTAYGVNGVTTGSSSTAASTNTASSTSTTASSQAPKAKKSTTTNTSSNSNTSTSANTQSQSTASNSSASTTTNTNTAASNANTTSSTNTAASRSQAVSQAPTASTSTATTTASASASAITSYALTFLGVPYVWGGTTPSGFDCSGFVQYVYSHFGINLGRTTYTQQYAGTKISVASAQAGDLYFWGSYGSAYHVAIALGGGQYVMAPAPGQNVMTGSVSSYTPSFAVRVLG